MPTGKILVVLAPMWRSRKLGLVGNFIKVFLLVKPVLQMKRPFIKLCSYMGIKSEHLQRMYLLLET